MLLLILLLTIRFSNIDTCPIFCQCYSALDGYHITCQNARLHTIPYNLTKYLQTTEHQNIIVDLSSNFLSILPCDFFQISTIITLILTKNKLEYIPSCFSQSSIQILLLNENHLRFNQTTILSSSKLIYLDLSYNKIPSLPQTFFFHLRKLRRLILNDENNLFQQNNDQWIRSITTRNQLTIIICNENFHLPLCLFDNLFQSNKLLSIELNSNIHCDCSFVYLPLDKIHFHYCQSQQQAICNPQSSPFEQGHSLINLQTNKYRQICANEYERCQNKTNHQIELISLIKNSSINQTMTTTIVTIISSKKDNITAAAVIPFVLVLIIVTVVCLYVILSGQFFKMKNRERISDFIIKRKKRQDISNDNSDNKPSRFDECIPIENLNMNSNLHRTTSYSDEESDLTFYSIINDNPSSTSFVQSSMTEIDIILSSSSSSTINSSLSHETVIISNRNKQRIY